MDHEFRIAWAERELAHLKEMQAFAREWRNKTNNRPGQMKSISGDPTQMCADIRATLREVREIHEKQLDALRRLGTDGKG